MFRTPSNLSALGTSFLDLLFPPRCAHCLHYTRNERYRALCNECAHHITIHTSLFCGQCRARLPEQKKICHNDMPFILGAASDYSCDPIRALIHDLKFRFRQEAAEPLSALLAHYTSPLVSLTNKTLVVPIPLSRERERVRGFNQSLLIARGLATHLHIPLRANILVRTKHTPPQTEQVHFADRHHNVQHCFKVLKPLSKETILLVDDVITSGATLKEAARTLKRAGAGAIIALTVARA